jgi:glycolate oxidase iron-sulfur subunit
MLATESRAALQRGMPFSRWVKRLMLGPLLSNQGLFAFGMAGMRLAYQRTGLQRLVRASGVLGLAPSVRRMDRLLPRIPGRTVRQRLPEVVPAVGERRGRIGFFLGCAMNTIFADVTETSIRVLARLGYDVVIPPRVVCCGAPQVSMGEMDLARDMARHNVALFDGLDAIVTDCAACGAELKHYDRLLADPAVESFASRVRDFAEFVEPLMPDGLADIGPVTYHAPCHLFHGQGVCTPPKALLKRLCPEYRDLPEHDRCCGSAGMYWLHQPEISDATLARKLANIRATGARTVVTANPGCLLQLAAGRGAGDEWEVRHISEVVAIGLGGQVLGSPEAK